MNSRCLGARAMKWRSLIQQRIAEIGLATRKCRALNKPVSRGGPEKAQIDSVPAPPRCSDPPFLIHLRLLPLEPSGFWYQRNVALGQQSLKLVGIKP